jgi:hypothetical protein
MRANSSGYYILLHLMVGIYTISAGATGFEKYIQTRIDLPRAGELAALIRLRLGSVTQTVQVSGSVAQALTIRSATGGSFTITRFARLELNERILFTWRFFHPASWELILQPSIQIALAAEVSP